MSLLHSLTARSFNTLSSPFAVNSPTDRRGSLDWIIISLILITSVAYVARCIIKFFQKRRLSKGIGEEVILLIAWILSILQGAAQLRANYFGFGTLDLRDDKPALQWYFTSQILAVSSIACSKLAIVTFIIWSMKPQGYHNVMAWTTFGSAVLYAAVGILGTALQCNTPQSWFISPDQCPAQVGIITAINVVNILSDLMIIGLPFPIVLKVQFSDKSATKSRVIILSVFLVRIFVVALTLAYLVVFHQSHVSTNPTWAAVSPTQWLQGMVYVSVTVACLPAMFSFLKFMASGAMGVRMGGETVMKSLSGSGKGTLPSMKSQDMKNGTTTHVSGQRPSEDDTVNLVPADGIHIVTEVHVGTTRDEEASSEKTL